MVIDERPPLPTPRVMLAEEYDDFASYDGQSLDPTPRDYLYEVGAVGLPWSSGRIALEQNPALAPVYSRGLGTDPGIFWEMANSVPLCRDAVFAPISTITAAPWRLEQRDLPPHLEGNQAAIAAGGIDETQAGPSADPARRVDENIAQFCGAVFIGGQVAPAKQPGRNFARGKTGFMKGQTGHQLRASTNEKSSIRPGESCWESIILARRNYWSASLCRLSDRLVLSVSGMQNSAARRVIRAWSKNGGNSGSAGRKM